MRFRIRSAKRDEQADESRLAAIERSIVNGIADAEKEKTGLEKRVKETRDIAAVLMGNDTYGYDDREPAQEQELSASEQALAAARDRMRHLDAHVAHLHRLLELVRQKPA
jgi:hypothetical protein